MAFRNETKTLKPDPDMNTRIIAAAILLGALAASAEEPESASVIGVTEPGRQIDLSFPEPGVIRVIGVKEGDAVEEGALLAQLDCRVLEAQHEVARMRAASTAAVHSATATLEMRQQRLSQLERLAASERANADELARAKADREIAFADLQIAREAATEADLEARQIEAKIEERTLRAPFSGVVARIHRETGASVSPQEGPIITLVQLAELDLVVHLDHRLLDRLVVGTELPVQALDRPVPGTAAIAFISPVVDAPSGTARVRLTLPNPGGSHRSGVKYRIDLPSR
jgi:RND family efflux transporter MFP subunit